ncbi:MAG TPA: FxDxF family PEP-CTERM protein [Telluria sp.]|nr:FxDxF family PEP-CTERM protein [Telluria sp.]
MQKSKGMFAAIALASAALGSQVAYAADISNPAATVALVDNSAFFGALFTGNNAGNTFADKYSFTTASPGALTADVLSTGGNAKTGLDITGFGLFNASGELLGGTQLSTGATDNWTLSSANLAAGDYYVLVSGSMAGQSAGKYLADISLAPVPEPETYAMLLGGLGMLGFTARRRKRAGRQASA